jgi:hypothetical protein
MRRDVSYAMRCDPSAAAVKIGKNKSIPIYIYIFVLNIILSIYESNEIQIQLITSLHKPRSRVPAAAKLGADSQDGQRHPGGARRSAAAYYTLGTKRMGRPFARGPCTPRAERPPRQPRTLSVTVVGCSMGIWARTLRVDCGMDGFRRPSGAHFVVCSLLVLGPKYQILPSRRFCDTETLEKRNI